jgi:hypothetical protein
VDVAVGTHPERSRSSVLVVLTRVCLAAAFESA